MTTLGDIYIYIYIFRQAALPTLYAERRYENHTEREAMLFSWLPLLSVDQTLAKLDHVLAPLATTHIYIYIYIYTEVF